MTEAQILAVDPLDHLPPEWVKRWLEKIHDLSMLIDVDGQILDLWHSADYEESDLRYWRGRTIESVLSSDTRFKLASILEQELAPSTSPTVWRHVNLLGHEGNQLPILAVCMGLSEHAQGLKLMVCRDLRPNQATQLQFIQAHQEIEQTLLAIRSEAQKPLWNGGQPPPDTDWATWVRRTSLAQVLQRTSRSIERQCFQALLTEAAGDHVLCAQWAGISQDDWMRRVLEFDLG
ncbi:MAG: hypothetical protein QM527_06090 [Alphaproteobacteria bacterium]|nr:hypothetical protein [Alphaproteobacteria bacterium]